MPTSAETRRKNKEARIAKEQERKENKDTIKEAPALLPTEDNIRSATNLI